LALTQRAWLDVREAHNSLRIPESAAETNSVAFPSRTDLANAEQELREDERKYKAEWFTLNGGRLGPSQEHHRQPLFFDIALNYMEPELEAINGRIEPQKPTGQHAKVAPKVQSKFNEESQDENTSQSQLPPTSRLGGLLGSWWGRK
jgi:signal recognition particle subunit SRP68